MSEIAAAPRLVKHVKLTCGTDSFSKHVNNVQFTPSSSLQTWQGGTPDAVFSDQTNPTYVLDLTLVQDWETANSLCNYLLEHEGETAEIEYMPHADGKVSFIADVLLVAPTIGGPVGTYNESTVQMGSTKPELVRAP